MAELSKPVAEPASGFEITGWHGRHACQLRLRTQAELALCRRIIAHEVRALEPRLRRLRNAIEHGSPQQRRIEALARPACFELTVQPAGPIKAWSAPAAAPACAPASPPEPLPIRVLDWLAGRLPANSSIWEIASGRARTPLGQALQAQGHKVQVLAAGEGTSQRSSSGMPDRYRAARESLAGRLAQTEPDARRAVQAIILGQAASELDIQLLQGRLWPHQLILIAAEAPLASVLLRAWDGAIHACQDGLICAAPGPTFLDPAAAPDGGDWPKISVVTVSYNQAAFIEDCLRSVLDQDYPNLEYIVIDAVSTDGSIDIIRRFQDRISKLVIEPDEGQSAGLNKGFDLATGELLTWINSDDMLAPGALRRAALAFRRYGADLVVGGCERIAADGKVLYLHHPALPYLRPVPLGLAQQYLWQSSWEQGDYFFQPEVLFTADIWRRSGGFLKQHLYWAMDWELWIRMAMAGASVVHLPDTLGRSRQHAAQKTTADELYLFQLKNILLEHDAALAAAEGVAAALPPGVPIRWQPQAQMTQSILRSARPLLARLWRLRQPRRLWDALSRRLPPWLTAYLLRLRRKSRFAFSRSRIITGAQYAEFVHTRELLGRIETAHRNAIREHQALVAERDQLRRHCEDLNSVLLSNYRHGGRVPDWCADQIADFLMGLMFGSAADQATKDHVAAQLGAHSSLQELARSLAILHFNRQSAPAFDRARPLLRRHGPFPDQAEIAAAIGQLTVVDIGSEALAFENDVYAPLMRSWPAQVLGFDPFDQDDAAEPKSQAAASHGRTYAIRTLKRFVGGGGPALFRQNRMRATSSLLPGNADLVSQFSLLGEALETVATEAVETHRLDDILAAEDGFGGPIDFLKIDVQGGSLAVLEGASYSLARTLVCHVEVEFAEVYHGEPLFAEIDRFMRAQGFGLLDFAHLGRQRYKTFDSSATYFFHAGRLLWGDAIYVRGLDRLAELGVRELLTLAVIMHEVYEKCDCAAEALRHYDQKTSGRLHDRYVDSLDLGMLKPVEQAAGD